MSVVSCSTTSTTAYKVTADTTGTLVLQTGATPTTAVTIDGSQNVGIGTSSPATNLDIQNNSAQSVLQLRDVSNRTSTLKSPTGVLDGFVGTSTNHDFVVNAGASGGSGINLKFFTQNTERARIDSSGNLLVGKTSTANNATGFYVSGNGNADYGMVSVARPPNTTMVQIVNSSGNTVVGQISQNGSNTTYATSSDYRLKENVAPMTGALSRVAALKPCTYVWKATGESDEGFIAHELQEVCPSAVHGEKDAVNEDGSIKPQGIDTSFLVATLTAAIQELKAELDAAKADIATLKGAA